ncbi:LysE family translocator [Leisingera sp. S232]|uniref:LysE family translocator n=1 Tax=Leisingera sp. S232 TaxID=3415132 RepID=UPI00086A3C54|nr:translocator [Rhodobacteraceae bacterium (ex Bugula neritina AB1)]
MDTLLFMSFLTATLLIVVTPGPSVALASSQAVRFGPRAAAVTVAGDALGSVIHILIAVASLQTLMAMSEIILPYLQIAGGVFILFLAWQSLRSSATTKQAPAHVGTVPKATFFAGFFACVTNPKAIVFFVALFPGFISPEHSVAMQSLIYGAIFVGLDAAFIFGYALIAMYAFQKTLSGRFSIEKLSALGLLGVGALLVFKGYKELPSN